MDRQERRRMRHKKEQKRKLEAAEKEYEKAFEEAEGAAETYGHKSAPHKKALEQRTKAYSNLEMAKGNRGGAKSIQAKRKATPAGKMRARQAKEYMTEKDVQVSKAKDVHPGTGQQSGGMIGQSDMTAKKVTVPKAKKKIPQYYKGGGKVKKNYAYGGRVAKYKE